MRRRRAIGSFLVVAAAAAAAVAARAEVCSNMLAMAVLPRAADSSPLWQRAGRWCEPVSRDSGLRPAWFAGSWDVVHGDASAGRRQLQRVLAGMPPAERVERASQLLVEVGFSRPSVERVAATLGLVSGAARASSYMPLVRFLEDQANAGIRRPREELDRACALAIASASPASEFRDRAAATEAAYLLGRWRDSVTGDIPGALVAYGSALAIDPRDDSGGWAWMSGMRTVDLLEAAGRRNDARAILDSMLKMPDRYNRARETRERLARLDASR